MNPNDDYVKRLRNRDPRTLADFHDRHFPKLFSYHQKNPIQPNLKRRMIKILK
jgi:hypothetical protein